MGKLATNIHVASSKKQVIAIIMDILPIHVSIVIMLFPPVFSGIVVGFIVRGLFGFVFIFLVVVIFYTENYKQNYYYRYKYEVYYIHCFFLSVRLCKRLFMGFGGAYAHPVPPRKTKTNYSGKGEIITSSPDV